MAGILFFVIGLITVIAIGAVWALKPPNDDGY